MDNELHLEMTRAWCNDTSGTRMLRRRAQERALVNEAKTVYE